MTQDQSNRMETPTHGDDGTRQVDTASYEGTAFQCECGERFVHYCDLIGHIAKHQRRQRDPRNLSGEVGADAEGLGIACRNTILEKLEQTPRDWELLAGTRIRRPGCICPIVELSGLHKEGYSICAAALELSNELRDTIVASADNSRTGFYGPFDPELRAKLLKACGLESA